MGTKWKRYSVFFKVWAFVILTVASCHMVFRMVHFFNQVNGIYLEEDLFFATDYTETQAYRREADSLCQLMEDVGKYKSESYIREGGLLERDLLEGGDLKNEIQNKGEESYERVREEIEDQVSEWNALMERLERESKNIWYYIELADVGESYFSDGVSSYESVRSRSERCISNDGEDAATSGVRMWYDASEAEWSDRERQDVSWIFAFRGDYLADNSLGWREAKQEAKNFLVYALAWFAVVFVCLAYLVYATGKKAAEPRGVHLAWVDGAYNEVTVGFMVIVGKGMYGILWLLGENADLINEGENVVIRNLLVAVLLLLLASFYGAFLMLVRHIKNKTLLQNTALFHLLKWVLARCGRLKKKASGVASSLRLLYAKGNPMLKTFLLVSVLGIVTMIPFVGFITVPFALWLAYRMVLDFQKLKEGLEVVGRGTYDEEIRIREGSEFALLATGVNEIAAGLGDEVERRIKSERLKTELIVNVSHDIRTPLTSLITYADLLKNEETDNENIKKYVNVISSKSQRLKVLTDDLFESAKAASGNVHVNYGNVDVGSLLKQGLAEMDDKIRGSELEFNVNMSDEVLVAWADGRLLWRVLENLLSNVLKYSMKHSRVYINAGREEGRIVIELKNISATALNIPEDEFMERFKRGDVSRGSEGSGLGLDIAKSLMLCQNGELRIKVDGDLFKAMVSVGSAV